MAKDKKGKKAEKAKKTPNADKKKSKKPKLTKVAASAGKIAAGVIVEEIVAATLVAAAAAIRDPKKARAMAAAAGKELKSLTDEAAKEGSALWHLALDIAGKSLEFVGKPEEKAKARAKAAKPAAGAKRSGNSKVARAFTRS